MDPILPEGFPISPPPEDRDADPGISPEGLEGDLIRDGMKLSTLQFMRNLMVASAYAWSELADRTITKEKRREVADRFAELTERCRQWGETYAYLHSGDSMDIKSTIAGEVASALSGKVASALSGSQTIDFRHLPHGT